MNFEDSLERLEASPAFANFKKQHPDAFLCAGFFVINYEQEGNNSQQLDYSLKDKKVFTFVLDKEITIKEAETIEGKKESLPELDKDIKVDIDDVEKILEEELNNRKLGNPLKIIAVLQKNEGKQIWNLNCVLPGMELLRVHINTEDGDILKFEKKSMFDFVQKVK